MADDTVSLRALTAPTAAVLSVEALAKAGHPFLGVALGLVGLGVHAYVSN